MRTISQFVFRSVTIRSRITVTLIAFSLMLGFALGSLGCNVKVKAAPIQSQIARSGHLYVLNDCPGCANRIFGFAVDESTGALTPLPGFPLATGGNGLSNSLSSELLTIDRKNARLFAINDGTDTASAYKIDPVTGKLDALPFSPFKLGIGFWTTIAVHPSGLNSLLVVGDIGGNCNTGGFLESFKITATMATPAGSPQKTGSANPLSTAFSQKGAFVYTGGGFCSTIAGFTVNANGVLTPLSPSVFNSGQNPAAYATDAEERLFVVSRPFSDLLVYTTSKGVPTLVFTRSALTPPPKGSAGQGVLHPNGFYLVSDRAGTRGVDVYKIMGSSSATTLAPITGSPFASGGSFINVMALNQAGTFLFAANNSTHNLTTFRVNPTTGVLTAQGTGPVNNMGASGPLNGMAYLPASSTVLRPTITTIKAPAITQRIPPFGQTASVIVTVRTVSSPFVTPSGNVSLEVDGGALMTKVLSGGSVTFKINEPTAGNHSLVVSFNGSASFAPSKALGTLVVKPQTLEP